MQSRTRLPVGLTVLISCGTSDPTLGEGAASLGVVVGALAEQQHASPDGSVTVKGPMPATWKPYAVASKKQFALRQTGTFGGQVAVGVDHNTAVDDTPEKAIRAYVTTTKPKLAVAPNEFAPGRWGFVEEQGPDGPVVWFNAHARWKIGERQLATCWVIWKAKDARGALDLCKGLEVSAELPK